MSTTIKQTGAVEYELEIQASKEQLDPIIKDALTKVRPSVEAKGFRKGRVPLGMVKKMYGESVAMEAIYQYIQENYEEEVLAKEEHDVMGRPIIEEIDYKLDQDLKARVKFGVRPSFILADLAGKEVVKPVINVKPEEVDREIELMREQKADWAPHTEEIGAKDLVTVTMAPKDQESGEVKEDEKQEGLEISLGEERLAANIREALLGHKIGETVEITMEIPGTEDSVSYALEITETKKQDLPELNDEFAKEISEGQFDNVTKLEAEVKTRIQDIIDSRLKESFEEKLVDKMVELNPMEVPESAIALYLDSFVEDVKRKNQNNLPEDFDEEKFREENTEAATRLVHWMIIKDKVLLTYDIKVQEDDLVEYLSKGNPEEGKSPEELLEEFRNKYPQMIDQLNQTIANQKVFDSLKSEFKIVEEELKDEEE